MRIKWTLRAVLGLVLVILAGVSLLIDAAGIVQVWLIREPATNNAIATLNLLNRTLETTSQGLAIAKTSLVSVTNTIGALQTTVSSAAATIESAGGAVKSLGEIMGTNLSNSLDTALQTLESVRNSTQVIDDFLGSVSQIPFVNLSYNPEQRLSETVGKLEENLSQVPASLRSLEANLETSGDGLDKVGDDASSLAASLGQVQTDLEQLVSVVEQYEQQVKAFQQTVQLWQANIVTIIWGIVLFATFVLLWLGATMLMVLFKGLEWMGVKLHLPGEKVMEESTG